MATTAQRDRQIAAAGKRIETATTKAEKARRDLAEHEATIKVQTERVEWLKAMPVDDPENDEARDADDDTGSVTLGEPDDEDADERTRVDDGE
jgi:hypothetical protein